MGYTETSLQEHVTSEHAETPTEVICAIFAALPGGSPNHVMDDLADHLTLEHRAPRDLDESSGVQHICRMFHPGWGLGGPGCVGPHRWVQTQVICLWSHRTDHRTAAV